MPHLSQDLVHLTFPSEPADLYGVRLLMRAGLPQRQVCSRDKPFSPGVGHKETRTDITTTCNISEKWNDR